MLDATSTLGAPQAPIISYDAMICDDKDLVDADPDVHAHNSAFRSDLEAALAELPHRQRACWLMREVEEMKHLDIGSVMTMSPDAVRGQVSRARITLHDRLDPWR